MSRPLRQPWISRSAKKALGYQAGAWVPQCKPQPPPLKPMPSSAQVRGNFCLAVVHSVLTRLALECNSNLKVAPLRVQEFIVRTVEAGERFDIADLRVFLTPAWKMDQRSIYVFPGGRKNLLMQDGNPAIKETHQFDIQFLSQGQSKDRYVHIHTERYTYRHTYVIDIFSIPN